MHTLSQKKGDFKAIMKETSFEGGLAHPTSGPLTQKSKYLTVYSHVVGQVCLISRSGWLQPTLVTADNLVASLKHLGCCRSLTSTVYCAIRWEQRWATYTDVISEDEHIHTYSSNVNILTLLLRQIHTHLIFAYDGGGLSHTNKHSSAFPPPPPLDVCSF